jgi:hypothetical protein
MNVLSQLWKPDSAKSDLLIDLASASSGDVLQQGAPRCVRAQIAACSLSLRKGLHMHPHLESWW